MVYVMHCHSQWIYKHVQLRSLTKVRARERYKAYSTETISMDSAIWKSFSIFLSLILPLFWLSRKEPVVSGIGNCSIRQKSFHNSSHWQLFYSFWNNVDRCSCHSKCSVYVVYPFNENIS